MVHTVLGDQSGFLCQMKLWSCRPPKLEWKLHPRSQQLETGADLQLEAEATGAAPLHYQWLQNGQHLPGWEMPSITITGVTTLDGGEYTCQVEDGNGQKSVSKPAAVHVFER